MLLKAAELRSKTSRASSELRYKNEKQANCVPSYLNYSTVKWNITI